MSINVTFNGSTYVIPTNNDKNWGTSVTTYLAAIPTGCLQQTGGPFTMVAETNFGSTYGFILKYLKSAAANIGSSGYIRLGNSDILNWRNSGNTADLPLSLSSDKLQFNSIDLVDVSSAQSLSNKSLTGFATSKIMVSSSGGALATSTIVSSILDYLTSLQSNAVGITDELTLTNKTLLIPIITAPVFTSYTDFAFAVSPPSSPNPGYLRVYSESPSVISAKTSSGTTVSFITASGTQTLTNKTLSKAVVSDYLVLTSTTAPSPTVSSGTAGIFLDQSTAIPSWQNSSGVTRAFVDLSSTQTLTNKSLTFPSITSPVFSGSQTLSQITTPPNPNAGQIKFYSKSDNSLYVLTSTGTESQVVTSVPQTPSGVITMWGGTAAPTGYLLCDGSAVSRTLYSNLFSAIGTAYGYGDTTTTFNIPDFRGLFPRGVDGSAGRDPNALTRSALNLGGNTGNSVGSYEADNLVSHAHTVTEPNSGAGHTHSGTHAHTHTQTDHDHISAVSASPANVQWGASGSSTYNTTNGTGYINSSAAFTSGVRQGTQSTGPASTTTLSINSSTTGITVNNFGGSETRPKNVYVNFIIKT